MPDFAPAFRQAGLSVDQQMLGFAPQGDLLFLPQEKEAKELGQKLQLLVKCCSFLQPESTNASG